MVLFCGHLQVKEDDGVGMAAQLAEDALHARVTHAVTSSHPWVRFAERLYHNNGYRLFYLSAAWLVVVGLANFELPRVYLPGQELSAAAVALLRVVDVLWLLLVVFDLCVQVAYTGWAVARTRGWLVLKAVVVLVLFCNLFANIANGTPYVARALRPLLLLERMRNVRKIAATTVETMPRIVSVMVLLVLNLVGHSILGFLLFAGIEKGNCTVIRRNNPPTNCSTLLYPPDTCDNYFASLGESSLHMFELLTAVNFPTIALPAMRCNPLSVLFFISYVSIAVYLLFNLALAVAYTEFYLGMRAEVLVRFYRIFSGLDKAFTVLVAQQRSGAAGVRTAAATVVAWGERPVSTRERGGSSSRSSVVAWDEIISSYDRTPQGTINCATFTAFFRRMRPHLGDVDGVELSAALFASFASGSGSEARLDAHAFRRVLLLFGNVQTQRDPTLADVDDALTREENLEIEVFCSGPRPNGGSSSSSSSGVGGGQALAPAAASPQAVLNPLSAAAPNPSVPGTPSASLLGEGGAALLGQAGGAVPSQPSAASVSPNEASPERSSESPVAGRRSRSASLLPSLRATFNFSRPSGQSFTSVIIGGSAGAGGEGGAGAPRSSRASWGGTSFSRASFAWGGGEGGSSSNGRALTRLMDVRRTHYMHASMAVHHGGKGVEGSVNNDSGAGSAAAAIAPLLPSARTPLCSPAAWTAFREWLLPIAESKAAAWAFDISTFVAGVFLLVQLTLETDEPGNPYKGAAILLNQLQFSTLSVGIVYVTLRLLAWGPARYWKRGALNRFDLIIIYATTVGLLLGTLANEDLWLGEVLTFMRILRLSRVFRFIPGFSSTVLAFKDILPLLGQHVLILLSSLYAFAIVGMYAFGGKLVASNPAVALSSYGAYEYYDFINFDTLPQAMFSQFYLLTINDWVALMEGSVAAVGKSARLYYILFWPINVLFLLNLIIAFITVAFGAEKDRRDAAMAAARAEAPEGLLRDNQQRGAFLSAAVFTVGVLDWRQLLTHGGADVRGWLFTRKPRFNDVYDALFKDDVQKTFPETLGKDALFNKE